VAISNSNVSVKDGSVKDDRIPWQDEPDPTMPSMNPFTQARNLALKKQTEIAESLGVGNTDIIRLEQAVFTFVSPKFIKFYTEELNLSENWEAGYRQFQRLMRIAAPRPIHGVWQKPPGEFTFRRWRLHNWPTLSQVGWCKAFCVHPAALYSIEKGASDSISVDILLALMEANIMNEDQARNFAFQIRSTLKRQRLATNQTSNSSPKSKPTPKPGPVKPGPSNGR
jgi:hypothetical protein